MNETDSDSDDVEIVDEAERVDDNFERIDEDVQIIDDYGDDDDEAFKQAIAESLAESRRIKQEQDGEFEESLNADRAKAAEKAAALQKIEDEKRRIELRMENILRIKEKYELISKEFEGVDGKKNAINVRVQTPDGIMSILLPPNLKIYHVYEWTSQFGNLYAGIVWRLMNLTTSEATECENHHAELSSFGSQILRFRVVYS